MSVWAVAVSKFTRLSQKSHQAILMCISFLWAIHAKCFLWPTTPRKRTMPTWNTAKNFSLCTALQYLTIVALTFIVIKKILRFFSKSLYSSKCFIILILYLLVSVIKEHPVKQNFRYFITLAIFKMHCLYICTFVFFYIMHFLKSCQPTSSTSIVITFHVCMCFISASNLPADRLHLQFRGKTYTASQKIKNVLK